MELKNIDRTVAIGVASSVASLVVGSVAGYLVAKRRLERKYEAIAQDEIAEARRKLKMVYKKDEFATPASLVESTEEDFDRHLPVFDEAVTGLLQKYDPPRQFAGPSDHNPGTNGQPLSVDIHHNVFEEQIMAGNEPTEEQWPVIGERIPGRPYVICFAEFDAGELGFRNVTMTYYADQTLIEEGDTGEEFQIVEDLIGEENLQYFGWEPGYPNVIYVRNERLRFDYEVIRDEREFGRDMLGLQADNPTMQQIRHMQAQHHQTPNAGPRARFSNYTPGGVVRTASE